MRYTDRSRTETDHICRRARYWQYEYLMRGLEPMQKAKELVFGGAMAEAVAKIKLGQPYDLKAFVGLEQEVAEVLLLAYEHYIWPGWLKEYRLVAVELESPLLLNDGLTYNSKPDTIMQRMSDGTYWYGPEDKTTAWVDSLLGYEHNVQLHATALAIEEHLPALVGEPHASITGCFVQGLYKGYEKDGKLNHPLVYAYSKLGIPGITPDQWSVKWQRNWERRQTKEYVGGVRGWLEHLKSTTTFEESFPCSQPVMLNRRLAQQYLFQVELREGEIEQWSQLPEPERWGDEFVRTFPQSFSQCDKWSLGRKPCTYKELCFNPTAAKFPLTFYRWREPHHKEPLVDA